MSLIDLHSLQLPGALTLPKSEAEILAALEGEGYLLMPFNGLPVIIAVSSNKISAGACERIVETRLETMQNACRAAGFKPGDSIDLSKLVAMENPDAKTEDEAPAEQELDEDGEPIEAPDYGDEGGEGDDEPDELPFESEQEQAEKLRLAAAAIKENSKAILAAEIDAVMPAVLAWGVAGHGWGLPGRGDKPTREDVAGDNFVGRSLRSALLDGFLRPMLRGSQTQAAFHPNDLFPQEKEKPKE